jgi:diguanylate cyclase (GGDEF)-like protein
VSGVNTIPRRILCVGLTPPGALAASEWGPFELHTVARLDEAAAELQAQRFDAVLLPSDKSLATWPGLSHATLDAAVLAVGEPQVDLAARLLAAGVQDLVSPAEAADAALLGRRLRLAIERKALEQAARKSYATDLATGLPTHAQLLEHMTHLLALREREPAPMAMIAVRIEGLATTEARLGAESANVLRRKVAVRLRAALRASDVVAAIGNDVFAVLLAWIDAPADGERVARKLTQALQRPFKVTGHDVAVAVSAGLALYPEHGRDADSLLRRAVGQAAGQAALGRTGFANLVERGPADAANDDET